MSGAILIPLITAAAGLIGVIVGSWLTDRRERDKQRRDYITRQLSELYGPLLSLRRQVSARHELRGRIDSAICDSWDDDRRAYIQNAGFDEKTIRDTIVAERAKFHEHARLSFEGMVMPDYQRMVTLMRENMWLAEKSTRDNFNSLVEYVDTSALLTKNIIKGDIVEHLGFGFMEGNEFKLQPFYADLETIHDRLRTELTSKHDSVRARVKKFLYRGA